jgi:hypothetical protein
MAAGHLDHLPREDRCRRTSLLGNHDVDEIGFEGSTIESRSRGIDEAGSIWYQGAGRVAGSGSPPSGSWRKDFRYSPERLGDGNGDRSVLTRHQGCHCSKSVSQS